MGPCLCGDPYCPSCGDPSLALWEDAIDKLSERLEKAGLDEYEFKLFVTVGFAAIEAHREANRGLQERVEDEASLSFE